jgi:hypothetical protein
MKRIHAAALAGAASKRKRGCKVVPVLGAAGLSLSLASAASATTGGMAADTLTRNIGLSLREQEVSDVSLVTFYAFDKERPDKSLRSLRFAVGTGGGCWTGTYYTSQGSGNDAYGRPPHSVRPAHPPALKHAPKSR